MGLFSVKSVRIMQSDESLATKLHSQTAKICWHDLQPHFAQGSVLVVDKSLDLIAIAADIADDNAEIIQSKIDAGLVAPPNNDLAREWYQNNTDFWAVVVAPFVLIQLLAL